MIIPKISDTSAIGRAYNSLGERFDAVVRNLRSDYEKLIEKNVYYRKYSVGKILLTILFDLIFLFLTGFYLLPLIATDKRFWEGDILSYMPIVFGVPLILCLYRTVIIFYCKKLEKFKKRIDRLEKRGRERILDPARKNLLSELNNCARSNKERDVAANNDLGGEIASIRRGLSNANARAYNVKRIVGFTASAVMLVILIALTFSSIKSYNPNKVIVAAKLTFLGIYAAAAINISMLNTGEYLGKYAKAVGSGMTLLYGICLFSVMKSRFTMAAVGGITNFPAEFLNNVAVIVPILQTVGIILTVCFSHYNIEREYWKKGFKVPMAYGIKQNGNKPNLIFRGTISLVMVFCLCSIGAVGMTRVDLIFNFAVLWYFANTLLKPRGSYLYTFWGRGKCIANEVVMAAAYITMALCSRGTLNSTELMYTGTAFLMSFLAAGIAKVINNII